MREHTSAAIRWAAMRFSSDRWGVRRTSLDELPNLVNVTLQSDTLGRSVRLRVSANALRTVECGYASPILLITGDATGLAGYAKVAANFNTVTQKHLAPLGHGGFEARVWTSEDGRTFEEVTLPDVPDYRGYDDESYVGDVVAAEGGLLPSQRADAPARALARTIARTARPDSRRCWSPRGRRPCHRRFPREAARGAPRVCG